MKIEKVHIKNIKGIKDLELSFKKDNKNLDKVNMQYQNTFKGKLVNVLKNDNNKFNDFN